MPVLASVGLRPSVAGASAWPAQARPVGWGYNPASMGSASVTDHEDRSSPATQLMDGSVDVPVRRSPSAVGWAAGGLIALQALFRWWAVLEGYFFEDDFPNIYHSTRSDLSFDLLFRGVNGHLKPGGYLLIWVLQRVAPMNFAVVALVLIALQLAASIVVWLLIRELLGRRVGALVPLAVYLFSPLTLGAFLWYATSIETVLLQLVMGGALLFHVRYVRHGRRADAVFSVLTIAFGLANWEKALLVVPVIALFNVMWCATGGVVQRIARSLSEHRWLWTAHATVIAAYVWLYLDRVGLTLGGAGVGSMPGLAWEGVGRGVTTALFGGWRGALAAGLGSTDSAARTLVPLLALLILVVVTTVLQRGAGRAWLFLGLYLVLDVFLLSSSGRGLLLGSEVGRDVRFFADASVVFVVALSLALFPRLFDERVPASQPVGEALERRWVTPAVIAVYVLNCAVTSFGIVHAWHETSAEPFVLRAQTDLRRLGDVVIADGAPPDDILSPWFLEDHRVSRVIGPLPERPRFDQPTDVLYVVDGLGHVVPATFNPAFVSEVGPDADCGWKVNSGLSTVVPMQTSVYPWIWTVRVSYYSGSTVPAAITVGDRRLGVVFEQGLHDLYFSVAGGAETVEIELLEPDRTACVVHVDFGHV